MSLPQISEAEFEVMKIVWKYAPINTNEITEKLTQTTSWSPKTIQTLIKRLVSKKALSYEKQSREKMAVPGFCRSVVLISPGLKKCMISHRKNFLIWGICRFWSWGEHWWRTEDGEWCWII